MVYVHICGAIFFWRVHAVLLLVYNLRFLPRPSRALPINRRISVLKPSQVNILLGLEGTEVLEVGEEDSL